MAQPALCHSEPLSAYPVGQLFLHFRLSLSSHLHTRHKTRLLHAELQPISLEWFDTIGTLLKDMRWWRNQVIKLCQVKIKLIIPVWYYVPNKSWDPEFLSHAKCLLYAWLLSLFSLLLLSVAAPGWISQSRSTQLSSWRRKAVWLINCCSMTMFPGHELVCGGSMMLARQGRACEVGQLFSSTII